MANVGNTQEPRSVPLHARLFWYELTAGELLVLQAYVDMSRDGDGKTLWASVPRIAAYTNLSVSQVQRIIGAGPKGDGKDKHGKPIPGLVAKRILLPMAKAKPKKMHSASYTLNEAALKMKPKILEYQERDRQRTLPGIHLPTRHGEPIRDEKPSAPPGRIMRPGYQPLQTLSHGPVPLPLVAPCDQGILRQIPPGSTMRPGLVAPCDQGIDSGNTPWSHHATSLVAPCDQPGSTMRPDPATGLDLIRLKDSSVLIENPSSSPHEVPVEVKNGLREILPSLDERAIKQLWFGCRDNAPDCTVEEVLHFAWEKSPALTRANTQNPAGLLIHALPLCFEGGEKSALYHYREEKLRAERRRADAAVQHAEDERTNQEWVSEMEEIERETENLDSLPAEEFQALHAEAEKFDWVRDARGNMPPGALEKSLRRQMAKIRLANKKQDKPPP
jgi:hypothetical protein